MCLRVENFIKFKNEWYKFENTYLSKAFTSLKSLNGLLKYVSYMFSSVGTNLWSLVSHF